MPVEDTPVHPHGQRKEGYRAGCYNRAGYAEGYWAFNREYVKDVIPVDVLVWIPNNHSKMCRQINDLPECKGCNAVKDVDYITKMKGLK